MSKIIIAIDGYSACGKSTTAKSVAKQLGYIYVDSGAMYRAVTLFMLNNNIDLQNEREIAQALSNIRIDFILDSAGLPITQLNGDDVEEEIREMRVSNNVSTVAAIPSVRRAMVKLQQQLGNAKGIVMDGRDIGTVVFPSAELKIFMTAKPEIRAERRKLEMEQKGVKTSLEDVMKNLVERDHKDTTRADSPLRQAEDAIILDNSFLTFDEQVDKIIVLANEIIEA
jgi:cytidylate kinase